MLRKKVTHRIPRPGARFYVCSLSPDVIVYKGQLTSDQVWAYFADLNVKSILLPFFFLDYSHTVLLFLFLSIERRIRDAFGTGTYTIFYQYFSQLGTGSSQPYAGP